MTKKILYLLLLISFACGTVYASNEPGKYTINFSDNCTISDALKQVQKATGIRLNINADIREPVIRSSFHNSDINQILKDLLNKKNYAVVWNYNLADNSPESIDIWFFEQGAENNIRPVSENEETDSHLSVTEEKETDTWPVSAEEEKSNIPPGLDKKEMRAIMEGAARPLPDENPFSPNLFDHEQNPVVIPNNIPDFQNPIARPIQKNSIPDFQIDSND